MHRRLNVARTLLECDDITQALHEWIAAIDMFDMAVVTGSERLVCEILQSGASVEGWSDNESVCEPPLMRAVKNRQENMVRLLLRHGAKLRSQALIEGIRLRSVPMTRMLLDAGADPNCKDKLYMRGLALLVAVGHEELFRLLIERGAAMPSGDDLTSMLKGILSKSGLPELQMMLDRGVSLANQSFSLLQFAMRGTLEMLDFLYNNGFLKETTYPDARYMRHVWALMANPLFILHPHLLGWLLDKGLVDMPCCGADPYSILVGLFQSNADDQQKEKTVDELVRHGIDINLTTQQNSRPVVWNKVILHSKVALKAFLDRGAKMLPEHADGHKSLLSRSRSAEHLEMMLNAVLRDSSRAQARRLLLDMKEYAGEKKWPTVRCLERFQYQNGLY